ncbi:MAG: hypothetical protein KF823_07955, partial [Xanthomonadales bacterium]|nr:hypothetical protein [Xanthomonadales bacterium]
MADDLPLWMKGQPTRGQRRAKPAALMQCDIGVGGTQTAHRIVIGFASLLETLIFVVPAPWTARLRDDANQVSARDREQIAPRLPNTEHRTPNPERCRVVRFKQRRPRLGGAFDLTQAGPAG